MGGNGRPKGCFGESIFFSAPLRFALFKHLKTLVDQEHLAVHFRLLDDRFSRCFSALPFKLEIANPGRNYIPFLGRRHCSAGRARGIFENLRGRNLFARGLLGDNKRDNNPLYGTFWTHFEWLEVA